MRKYLKIPYFLELHPSLRCNLDCKFCLVEKKQTDELDDEFLFRIISEALRLKIPNIKFVGGGEPLIRRNLYLFLLKQKRTDQYFNLATNFTLLDRDLLLRFLRFGWNQFTISLDGDERTHDFLRGKKGTYSKVIENLTLLHELTKKYNLRTPRLEFNTVLNNFNYKNLSNIIRTAVKFRINRLYLDSMFVLEKNRFLDLNEQEITEFKRLLKQKYLPQLSETKINHNYALFINHKDPSRYIEKNKIKRKIECNLPNFYLLISGEGKCYPCCHLTGKIPDAPKITSILDTFNSSYFLDMRFQFRQGNFFKNCECCSFDYRLDLENQWKESRKYLFHSP